MQVEGETGQLIPVVNQQNGPIEQTTAIPRSQAEALLELTVGRVEYLSVSLNIGSQTAMLRRFLTPGSLDLITVTSEQSKRARKVLPLAWFGPEVTGDPGYQGRSLALSGLPPASEVEITDVALNSLLDVLEGRFGAHQPQTIASQAVAPSEPAEAEAEADKEEDQDELAIEDSVIRELARSLSPRQR